jgi:uncharacterized protein YcbK (DUF882 family)
MTQLPGIEKVSKLFSCKTHIYSYNPARVPNHQNNDEGLCMNRRIFLGLALSAVTAPVFARFSSRETPRVLNLRHTHTDETLRIAYRNGDSYQRDALVKLNHFLRDHYSDETTFMDPKLFDLLYDLQTRVNSQECEIEVYSGYRSPQTNANLRRASKRVARNSLHMSGQAIDVSFAGCCNSSLRECAVALSRGGVGYYGNSSSFVHLDTGPVRTWRS